MCVGLTGELVCIDHSYGRVGHLKSMLRRYLPREAYLQQGSEAQVIHADGNVYCSQSTADYFYDRVCRACNATTL